MSLINSIDQDVWFDFFFLGKYVCLDSKGQVKLQRFYLSWKHNWSLEGDDSGYFFVACLLNSNFAETCLVCIICLHII